MNIFLVLSVFLLKPTLAEDRKTHLNNAGFRFDYPSSWRVEIPEQHLKLEDSRSINLLGPTEQISKGRWMTAEIACYPIQEKKLEPIKIRAASALVNPQTKKIGERDLKVSGFPASEVTSFEVVGKNPFRNGLNKMIAFDSKKLTCSIWYHEEGSETLSFKDDSRWIYQKDMEEVISSFKFVDAPAKKKNNFKSEKN